MDKRFVRSKSDEPGKLDSSCESGRSPSSHSGSSAGPSNATNANREKRLERDLEKPPREFGIQRSSWDGPTLVLHLKKRFGVNVKVRQAQYWLHSLDYSLKRAGYVYLQARAKDARRFRQELKKTRQLKVNETIVFQDETGFSLHPRLGRGWAKKGTRLKVPTTSQHRERLNISGWVAPLLGRKGVIRTAKGNRKGSYRSCSTC